jgi:hypothetical protein
LCGNALGIVLAMGAAAPSSAQYPRESTPEERAQTQELNRGGVRVVRPTPQEAQTYANARAQYEADEARYQRELDEYNARMRDFGRQQQNTYDPGPNSGQPDRDDDRYDDRGGRGYGNQGPDPRDYNRDNNDRDYEDAATTIIAAVAILMIRRPKRPMSRLDNWCRSIVSPI